MTIDELIRKELGDGEIYISQLYGDDKHLSIMTSDKYGNDIDNAPYVVDINNGKSIYMKDGLTNCKKSIIICMMFFLFCKKDYEKYINLY